MSLSSFGSANFKWVWACPPSKSVIEDFRTGYGYNYLALGGSNGGTCPTSATFGAGLGAVYTPFNGPKYALPAPLGDLNRPSDTILLSDGAQLLRPPAVVQANGNNYTNSGVWGAHEPGSTRFTPAAPPVPDNTTQDIRRLYTGKWTNVVYCDGHVKAVRTQKLVPSTVVMEGGTWKGEALGGATLAGNAGWTRD